MAAARPHSPSAQRIAEARASGHLPRAPLVGFAGALLALLAGTALLGPAIAQRTAALLRGPLELAAAGRSREAHAQAELLLQQLARSAGLLLGLGCIAIALFTLLAQGPSLARLSSSRSLRVASLRPSRTASALWCVGLCVIVLTTLASWTELERATLSQWAVALATELALLTVACSAIDIAFARARFFASLWLTRREYLDEQREQLGAPELRAARRRARDDLRRSPALGSAASRSLR
ncbi:MAG: hypothetical protein JWN48_3135 [Myxococcaceae bacterium]|nr:hypothetical protein [Myxococcaceae bacterium]